MTDYDAFPDDSAAPHPDSILRLASAVHRFSIPYINPEDQLSFEESFKSCASPHGNTLTVMRLTDSRRQAIKKNMADGKLNHAALSKALTEYIPSINQILLSCKFQPEVARLDKRLLFSWSSGIENIKTKTNKPHHFDSEALMFELVLSLATFAISESNVGCDSCIEGDFPAASRQFARTAGIFHTLGDDILPNWMANSKQHARMENESLAETRVGVCVAFAMLYTAMAQQMAVATVLVKPGVPNYALVGKLCAGVAEDLDGFVGVLRSKSPVHMSRMDPSFLTLITFSINVQRAISLYFLARSLWTACEYGVAIAALSEATVAMRTRSSPTGRGLPEIEPSGPLQSLVGEMNGFRMHMGALLNSWEKDNSLVYFDKVPPSVPANKALKAIKLKKMEEYTLEMRDPLTLGPKDTTAGAGQGGTNTNNGGPPSYDDAAANDPRLAGRPRSDSDLARELQAKLNAS
mmetsp:Transcript_2083/g.3821  ORF Transcript_2083/g.3821 Transcript_2083/m.3821 type:complete len:464 (-) Transcript_2083:176-1567(-)|eukprot:CAMPEP_0196133002 /NCGR_PEP_ID=MMETSP0910-20130528/2402_1 /TAXON_ID=49265 /ORGANISM="Thalassiosira rotula, Strain GSO102" /LENGTH=463 /DNA_ID=CAMNT_0041392675 /DNA_START=137 /DNA_END=1528 /DNA_ORIENTATION=-